MHLPESLKAGLRAFTTLRYSAAPKEVQLPRSVHDTPAGVYPSEGPQPSKWPVLFYYLSVVLCITGVISLGKCVWIQHEAREQLLVLGFSFVFVGFFFLHIANWLYNREFNALIGYLRGQVEELRRTHTPVSALDRI